MVIQLIYLQPDNTTKTRTYRDVKPGQKSEMMKTFYEQRTMYPGGIMVQLNGKERLLVCRFGKQF
jgi:hypothetical protein